MCVCSRNHSAVVADHLREERHQMVVFWNVSCAVFDNAAGLLAAAGRV
jgi:hypothetical protein